MCENCQLLLFTRYPEVGKTKTRLIPKLGEEGAALLQKRLTERITNQADLLKRRSGIKTVVHYSGGNKEQMTSWLGDMEYMKQTDGDLGEKMRTAFERTFASGTKAAILVGSDIPDITTDLLQQAFTTLLSKDVVIGPSQDGGYYLIGIGADKASQLLPLLFNNLQWSTNKLLATTITRLKKSDHTIANLITLRDIDLPTDLSFAAERGLL